MYSAYVCSFIQCDAVLVTELREYWALEPIGWAVPIEGIQTKDLHCRGLSLHVRRPLFKEPLSSAVCQAPGFHVRPLREFSDKKTLPIGLVRSLHVQSESDPSVVDPIRASERLGLWGAPLPCQTFTITRLLTAVRLAFEHGWLDRRPHT
jgi:hypothetical protein